MTRLLSTFTRGTQDWTIAGDVNVFEQRDTGGNPGGYLFWEDAAAGSAAYWAAPVRFAGDQTAFRGGKLTFDWFATAGPGFAAPDVILSGSGLTLYADVAAPTADWGRVSLKLNHTGGWHVGAPDGPMATTRQISTVLQDVSNLLIRADHRDGDERGGLDNVAFRSRPDPALFDAAETPFAPHPAIARHLPMPDMTAMVVLA